MKKGFTLIELLIVIIIIGILATMAFPQYQKMVNRSRWAECMSLSSAIKSAESLYYAENGSVYRTGGTANIADLATLDLPATTARAFRFTLRTSNIIYGYHSSASAADDVATPPLAHFYINLTSNATGYDGSRAPGSLT